MVTIGTPKSATATKVLLCGSGELGKEFVIELQRYGVEVIALDKYADAPAMQVAHRSYEVSMLDGKRLREIIEAEKPDYIIPEIEAIATDTLLELEAEGYHVVYRQSGQIDHEPRRYPPSGCGRVGIADLSVSFRLDPCGIYGSRARSGHSVRSETGDELFGTRTKRNPHGGRCRAGMVCFSA